MRICSQTEFIVTDGPLAIVDPGYVFESIDEHPYVLTPPNCACFYDFGGDGNFNVYESPECLIVDTAPRQFKPSTRTTFTRIDGTVYVDSGIIAFVNLSDAPAITANPTIPCVVHDMPPGKYIAWAEVNENSYSHWRTILGLGKSPHLFLNKKDATTIYEIEKRVATALRLKGQDRANSLDELRKQILDLHWSGSKDNRLQMLANAIKLDLPRRNRRRAT